MLSRWLDRATRSGLVRALLGLSGAAVLASGTRSSSALRLLRGVACKSLCEGVPCCCAQIHALSGTWQSQAVLFLEWFTFKVHVAFVLHLYALITTITSSGCV